MADSPRFHELVNQQIDNEFFGAHQYVATGAFFDSVNMPVTAGVFYKHAGEERGHALRFVRYLLDRSLPVRIGGVAEVVNDFAGPRDALQNAVDREKEVTDQVFMLAQVALHERDWFGKQFMDWFIAEQREEENLFTTLQDAWGRCDGDWLGFEQWVHRNFAKD